MDLTQKMINDLFSLNDDEKKQVYDYIQAIKNHEDERMSSIINSIDIKTNKRSLNANAYCWLLIGKIADEVGKTKEEVYRDYIHDKGIYRIITINKEAVNTFKKVWQEKGLGWICEESENNIAGLIDIIAYYGTSSYNSKQMSVFLDYIVQEAKQLNIQTKDEIELERLLKEWK